MRQYMRFIDSTCFGHLLHLVGPLPYTMSTMHSHMNIKFEHFKFIFNTFSPAPFSKFLHILYLKCE
jgi:hypothetical protein